MGALARASGFKLEILASHLSVQLHFVIAHAAFNTGILNHDAANFVFLYASRSLDIIEPVR